MGFYRGGKKAIRVMGLSALLGAPVSEPARGWSGPSTPVWKPALQKAAVFASFHWDVAFFANERPSLVLRKVFDRAFFSARIVRDVLSATFCPAGVTQEVFGTTFFTASVTPRVWNATLCPREVTGEVVEALFLAAQVTRTEKKRTFFSSRVCRETFLVVLFSCPVSQPEIYVPFFSARTIQPE
jgi:hypothetical protein